jgi:AcrR family transcriptional regulator
MSMTTDSKDREDTRGRIVATAERLFRSIGYQKTTVADIAKELHMSPANVYRFFPSKADIRDAVGRQLMTEVEAATRAIADRDGPATGRLRELLITLNTMNRQRYLSDQKMHEMVAAALDESWGMVLEHIGAMEAIITKVVADGMASGEFCPGDAGVAARCVKSAVVSFCHPRLLEECASMPEPTIEQMVDFCLRALTAGSARPA